jgi:ParB family chromosome partitioning protein
VPLAFIEPNPRNPRHDFPPSELTDLAVSIKAHGLVQPLVVRPAPGGEPDRYEIIAGERRWRAAQIAGLHEVPITILEVSDRQALELAIVENVQRADLNPIEEALGYQALVDEFGYTQGDLAETIGKSRVHVTNTLRLLKLPDGVRSEVTAGRLTAGHARALVNARDPERLMRRIIARGLTVRDAERLAQSPDAEESSWHRRGRTPKDADTQALEKALEDRLGLKFDIRHSSGGQGELRVKYKSLDQLEALCRLLQA